MKPSYGQKNVFSLESKQPAVNFVQKKTSLAAPPGMNTIGSIPTSTRTSQKIAPPSTWYTKPSPDAKLSEPRRFPVKRAEEKPSSSQKPIDLKSQIVRANPPPPSSPILTVNENDINIADGILMKGIHICVHTFYASDTGDVLNSLQKTKETNGYSPNVVIDSFRNILGNWYESSLAEIQADPVKAFSSKCFTINLAPTPSFQLQAGEDNKMAEFYTRTKNEFKEVMQDIFDNGVQFSGSLFDYNRLLYDFDLLSDRVKDAFVSSFAFKDAIYNFLMKEWQNYDCFIGRNISNVRKHYFVEVIGVASSMEVMTNNDEIMFNSLRRAWDNWCTKRLVTANEQLNPAVGIYTVQVVPKDNFVNPIENTSAVFENGQVYLESIPPVKRADSRSNEEIFTSLVEITHFIGDTSEPYHLVGLKFLPETEWLKLIANNTSNINGQEQNAQRQDVGEEFMFLTQNIFNPDARELSESVSEQITIKQLFEANKWILTEAKARTFRILWNINIQRQADAEQFVYSDDEVIRAQNLVKHLVILEALLRTRRVLEYMDAYQSVQSNYMVKEYGQYIQSFIESFSYTQQDETGVLVKTELKINDGTSIDDMNRAIDAILSIVTNDSVLNVYRLKREMTIFGDNPMYQFQNESERLTIAYESHINAELAMKISLGHDEQRRGAMLQHYFSSKIPFKSSYYSLLDNEIIHVQSAIKTFSSLTSTQLRANLTVSRSGVLSYSVFDQNESQRELSYLDGTKSDMVLLNDIDNGHIQMAFGDVCQNARYGLLVAHQPNESLKKQMFLIIKSEVAQSLSDLNERTRELSLCESIIILDDVLESLLLMSLNGFSHNNVAWENIVIDENRRGFLKSFSHASMFGTRAQVPEKVKSSFSALLRKRLNFETRRDSFIDLYQFVNLLNSVFNVYYLREGDTGIDMKRPLSIGTLRTAGMNTSILSKYGNGFASKYLRYTTPTVFDACVPISKAFLSERTTNKLWQLKDEINIMCDVDSEDILNLTHANKTVIVKMIKTRLLLKLMLKIIVDDSIELWQSNVIDDSDFFQ